VEFPGLVEAALSRLMEKFGSDRVSVWNGEIFSIRSFAEQFFDIVRRVLPVSLFKYRHRLEATTGIDCRDFFADGETQFLEIAATLEEFLDSPDIHEYRPGVRYFFGHPIPD
jgi:hypothetical protein